MLSIELNGLHALVCGSTQGIGHAIARQMALAGATVTLMARDQAQLDKIAAGLPGKGHDTMRVDFSEPGELAAYQQQIRDKGFHILVNNTGGPAPGPVHQAAWEEFDRAINMHLRMSHQLAGYVLPSMKENRYGRIINVISTSVKIPLNGLGVSNTVRGAVASWAKTMANELGEWGITVNNLLPGFMETGRLQQIITNQAKKTGTTEQAVVEKMKSTVPVRRFGQPEEMGHIAAFLASPLAGYVSGTSIPVDGGRTGCI